MTHLSKITGYRFDPLTDQPDIPNRLVSDPKITVDAGNRKE